MDVRITKGRWRPDGPVEYFCQNCGQLRLSYVAEIKECANCGGNDLIIGKVGSLNKEKLKEKFYESNNS